MLDTGSTPNSSLGFGRLKPGDQTNAFLAGDGCEDADLGEAMLQGRLGRVGGWIGSLWSANPTRREHGVLTGRTRLPTQN
jgi:hypothetical protein